MAYHHHLRLANDNSMVRTCSRPRGGASLVVGPLDKAVDGVALERVVLPWHCPPPGPDTAGSCRVAPAGNAEAACSEPGTPHYESDTAGRGATAHADIVEARSSWGREQHNWDHAKRRPRPGERSERSRRRGLPPPGDCEQAGRGNAAHGPRVPSYGGGPAVQSRGQQERNRRRNRLRRKKRKGKKALVKKEAVKPPGIAGAELPSPAQGRQGRPVEPQPSPARAPPSVTPGCGGQDKDTAPPPVHGPGTPGHDGQNVDTAPPSPPVEDLAEEAACTAGAVEHGPAEGGTGTLRAEASQFSPGQGVFKPRQEILESGVALPPANPASPTSGPVATIETCGTINYD